MLPQQFEVYAHDDALSYRIESLPYIKDFDEHQEEGDQEKQEEEEEEEDKDDGDDGDDNDSKKSNEQAIELWTTSVARGTMVEFIKEIKKIRNMTYHGGRQLRTDIEYLINVLSTLDVQPLPELISMYRYFDLEESDLIKQLMNAKKNPNQEGEDALKAVAEIRGVVLLEF
jgi:high-affinity Fe2+/Pb2+ permease